MWYFIVTLFVSIIVILLLHIIGNKLNLSEYMKYISDKDISLVASLSFTAMLLILLFIFGENDFFGDSGVKIFGCIVLFNLAICLSFSKFLLSLMYKKDNESIELLKIKKKQEKREENNKLSLGEKISIITNIVNDKESSNKNRANDILEKEMEYNYLNEYEKELVRKGDYDSTNFEYPENGEKLDEDDYYSDDESWKD